MHGAIAAVNAATQRDNEIAEYCYHGGKYRRAQHPKFATVAVRSPGTGW